ncbi:MAG: nucleoside phosphorylase [Saprospiraceae bacterium]|nr:nucleoside phosphorylase [Saprospiraceae bacterium]
MKSSELILNGDGSIYHLHLLPEQVAPLIILVGDPDRVPLVSQYFDQVEHKVQKREFITHTGRIGHTRLSVVSTGIGPDNIDIVLNELDALFNIDLNTRQIKPALQSLTFIRIGTAGGLQAEIPVDAFVASSGAFGMDGLLQFYQAENLTKVPIITALKSHCVPDWDFPLQPYFASANANLMNNFQGEFHLGLTATNPGFYGPQGRRLRAEVKLPRYLDLLQSFEFEDTRILNLEMETSAIYGLSQLLGHRAISLSAILANRALGQFSLNPGKTVQNLIEQTLSRVESLSVL